jgi:hypothetical protein
MELPKILNNRIESVKSDIDNFQVTFYMCEIKYIGNFPNMCSNIPASLETSSLSEKQATGPGL